MLLVSHAIRILTDDYHLFYKYKNTRNDNRTKKKMFRNQQKSYIYKDVGFVGIKTHERLLVIDKILR